MTGLTPSALINRDEVVRLTGLSRATIDRLRQKGVFPQPFQISTRRVAWRADEIADWVDCRRRASTDQTAGGK